MNSFKYALLNSSIYISVLQFNLFNHGIESFLGITFHISPNCLWYFIIWTNIKPTMKQSKNSNIRYHLSCLLSTTMWLYRYLLISQYQWEKENQQWVFYIHTPKPKPTTSATYSIFMYPLLTFVMDQLINSILYTQNQGSQSHSWV